MQLAAHEGNPTNRVDIGWHSKDGEQGSEALNNCSGRDVRTGKHKREPGIFIDYVEKELVPIVARQRAFEVNVDSFERLCCLDEWSLFWVMVPRLALTAYRALTRYLLYLVKGIR